MPSFFATTPQGSSELLQIELIELGCHVTRCLPGGVHFEATVPQAVRACLWSRLAGRILLVLGQVQAPDPDVLYEGLRAIPWEDHFNATHTFAVRVQLAAGAALTHSHFAALRAKDAIVDRFAAREHTRPNVDTEQPSVRLNVHAHGSCAELSLEVSAGSLHRRGYRAPGAAAPLKEHLAAALVARSQCVTALRQGDPLFDPACGSGTLLVEAALWASDVAPGLIRLAQAPDATYVAPLFADPALCQTLHDEAVSRQHAGAATLRPEQLCGMDTEPRAVAAARHNARRAGVAQAIRWRCGDSTALRDLPVSRISGQGGGQILANLPFGERVGDEASLMGLYTRFGAMLRRQAAGMRAHLFVADVNLGHAFGMRAYAKHILYNGPLRCTLLHFEIPIDAPTPSLAQENRAALQNRLRKNIVKLTPWAVQQNITCLRLYDRDLPQYAVAIDSFENRDLVVHEYAAPKSIDPNRAQARLRDVLEVLAQTHPHIGAEHVHLKTRQRQRGKAQYDRLQHADHFTQVHEAPHTFWVNFRDFLDVGIYLDHREVRRRLGGLAAGKSFLNLFAYTATASVYAALGGATHTTSVDMSRTYLSWAAKNFERAGLSEDQHLLVEANCLEYLEETREVFDLIFVNPPVFSNSKRMTTTFDVMRDHEALVDACMQRLTHGGCLLFSTHAKGFRLNERLREVYATQDVSKKTRAFDFTRQHGGHVCFQISRK